MEIRKKPRTDKPILSKQELDQIWRSKCSGCKNMGCENKYSEIQECQGDYRI